MPKYIYVYNKDRQLRSPIRTRWCASVLCRFTGLMFKRPLNKNEAIMLVYPRDSRVDAAIHMLFVLAPLSVIWIDSTRTVVDTVMALPWHPVYAPHKAAQFVLEAHPDCLDDFRSGERVDFVDE